MDDGLLIGLTVPLLGTVVGAATVFFVSDRMHLRLQKALMGFAAGVMVAASVWSLLIPSMEMTDSDGIFRVVPATVGFLLGIVFLLGLDHFTPHQHVDSDTSEGPRSNLSKTSKLVMAVTIHNIPEGMAVGVALAGALEGNAFISFAAALTLSLGIAIQNFPEGAIVSMPLRAAGNSRRRAFALGALSGVVEPIAAIITILLTSIITPILPYLLAFAAGAMLYVVVEELIPETQQGEHSNIGTIGFAIGFALMMFLDVALG
ncbi:MAG: ZIP family metal transporter [Muribaculaceae bacterium]|nr:ZIP family metal transporter [Muribaculaceae bacterium]